MDTLADYEAWKSKQQQNSVGAANVVLSATEGKPDEIASDLNLASEFGKTTGNPVPPLPLVQEHRNVFQAEIARQKNSTILSSSPRLTEWLRNPDNARVANDDLAGLSWFEGFGRGLRNTLTRAGQRSRQMVNESAFETVQQVDQDRKRSFGEILDDQRGTWETSKGPVYKWSTPVDFIAAAGRFADARLADYGGADTVGTSQQLASDLAANIQRIKETPKSDIATQAEKSMFVDGASFGQLVQNIGTTILTNPVGVLSWALETAGESVPQLAAATAATVATRNPRVGIAAIGAGSYATERYTAPADFLAEKGIDLSKPNDVARVLSDPKIMKDAVERGVIRGASVATLDMISGGLAGVSLAKNPFIEAIAQMAQQAISGSLGEYTARVASGQNIDWNDILAEGLAEIATAPVDMSIAGREFVKKRDKAEAADARKALFEQLSGQATSSLLRGRMPAKFREFVAEATKNGPVENVFVPADKFTEYFQSIGVDPHELVDSLDGVTRDDLDAALAGGGDLQIPTSTYAAHIAGSEHDAFLMENMRFDPNEFTSAEAAEFNAKANEALQEAWDVAEQLRQQDEQLRSFEQEIYDTIVSRLRAAGRSTDVATTEAMLYPAFYRVMAQRSGLTTEEFMQQYPLPEVRGAIPEGMQMRDVDALTRTLAEARASKTLRDKRQTLLEFIADYGGINDVGGELAARDATVINRGKGKKSLRLARKGSVVGMKSMFPSEDGKRFGADDVALAAIERGYMADNSIVHEYRRALDEGREAPDITAALWDAIDAKLSGTPQYSSQDPIDPAIKRAEGLKGIEEYLNSVGVSLDDDDAKIRAALASADASSFEQFAGIGAKTLDSGMLLKA
jgi:hypothetical protein